MDISASLLLMNAIAAACLVVSLLKSRQKTVRGIIIAARSLAGMIPYVIIIVLFIGMMQGFISGDTISGLMGEGSGIAGVIYAGALGTIMHIPAIVAFPLTASLIAGGASIMSAAAFITTLTMVGLVTLPLEIKELGKKFAIMRNILSFAIAILISLIMGAVLG